jgi:hypothetical protein
MTTTRVSAGATRATSTEQRVAGTAEVRRRSARWGGFACRVRLVGVARLARQHAEVTGKTCNSCRSGAWSDACSKGGCTRKKRHVATAAALLPGALCSNARGSRAPLPASAGLALAGPWSKRDRHGAPPMPTSSPSSPSLDAAVRHLTSPHAGERAGPPPMPSETELAEAWFDVPSASSRRPSSPPSPASAVGEFLGDALADAWLR